MATIDEELSQIEKDIRQLKVEYDQYFGGGRKRPPTEIEWRIETLMKRYNERIGDLSFGHRFRFNNLNQTYAKYREVFRKRLQQKEEGSIQRHFGAAAKAIEAERARNQPSPPDASAASSTKTGGQPFRIACSEPDRETDKVEQLYQAFRSAKRDAGENVDRLSEDNFRDFVRKKTRDLKKQKGCDEVEYVVEVAAGKVKLKALVKS